MKVLSWFPMPVFPKISFPPLFQATCSWLTVRSATEWTIFVSGFYEDTRNNRKYNFNILEDWGRNIWLGNSSSKRRVPVCTRCRRTLQLIGHSLLHLLLLCGLSCCLSEATCSLSFCPMEKCQISKKASPRIGCLWSHSHHGSHFAYLFCLRPSLQFQILEVTEKF